MFLHILDCSDDKDFTHYKIFIFSTMCLYFECSFVFQIWCLFNLAIKVFLKQLINIKDVIKFVRIVYFPDFLFRHFQFYTAVLRILCCVFLTIQIFLWCCIEHFDRDFSNNEQGLEKIYYLPNHKCMYLMLVFL